MANVRVEMDSTDSTKDYQIRPHINEGAARDL